MAGSVYLLMLTCMIGLPVVLVAMLLATLPIDRMVRKVVALSSMAVSVGLLALWLSITGFGIDWMACIPAVSFIFLSASAVAAAFSNARWIKLIVRSVGVLLGVALVGLVGHEIHYDIGQNRLTEFMYGKGTDTVNALIIQGQRLDHPALLAALNDTAVRAANDPMLEGPAPDKNYVLLAGCKLDFGDRVIPAERVFVSIAKRNLRIFNYPDYMNPEPLAHEMKITWANFDPATAEQLDQVFRPFESNNSATTQATDQNKSSIPLESVPHS